MTPASAAPTPGSYTELLHELKPILRPVLWATGAAPAAHGEASSDAPPFSTAASGLRILRAAD